MSKPAKKTQPRLVIVAWATKGMGPGVLSTLGYGGSSGECRVYEQDKLDPRCSLDGKTPPYFRDRHEALEYMTKNPGLDGAIQLDVETAREIGIEVPHGVCAS